MNNKKNMFMNTKQIFSIRKYSLGAASVLLGTAFTLGAALPTETVLADENPQVTTVTDDKEPAGSETASPLTEASVQPAAAESALTAPAPVEPLAAPTAESVASPVVEPVATGPVVTATPAEATPAAPAIASAKKTPAETPVTAPVATAVENTTATTPESSTVTSTETSRVGFRSFVAPFLSPSSTTGGTAVRSTTGTTTLRSTASSKTGTTTLRSTASSKTGTTTLRSTASSKTGTTALRSRTASTTGTTTLRSATTGQNVNDKVTATTKFEVYGPGARLNPPVSQETNGGGVKIASSFTVDDSVIAGDYFTVQMGRNINYVGAGDIKTASGEVVAKLSYSAATETLTYTFTDYVDRMNKVSGSFTVITDPEFDKVTTDKQRYPVSVTVAGETATDNIIYDYGNNGPISSVLRGGRIITYVNADPASAKTYGSYTEVTIDSHGSAFTSGGQVAVYEIPSNYIAPDSYEVDLSKLRKVSRTTRIQNGNAVIQLSGLIPTRSTNRYVIISTPSGTTTGATASVLGNTTGHKHSVGTKVVAPESSAIGELPAPKTYSLGDTIWLDTNRDGVQNETGTGLQGVTVKLFDARGAQVGTSVTNNQGKYNFSNLSAGTYYVELIAPTNMTVTSAYQGGNDELDSDFRLNAQNRYVVLAKITDANITSIDGGLVEKTYTIGDTIWLDTNKDGIQNETGTGQAGVTVNLLDSTGNRLQTTTTNADGQYSFTVVTNGSYQVELVLPTGYLMTQANTGDDSKDSDFVRDSAGRYRVAVSINGADNLTIDGGLIKDVRGNVTVEHVSDTGEVLIATAPVKTNAPVGEAYTTSNRDRITTADGRIFTYSKVADGSAPVSGKVAEGTQHVKYVYTEVKGNVQITYVDTNGVSIKTTVADTTNAPIGTAYDTKQNANEYPSEITTTDGKVYRRVEAGTYPVGRTTADGHLTTSDAPTGKVTEATKTVTYVYQEVKGNVQITYVDTNGVSIKTTVADTTNAPIGTAYDTKQNANEYPSEITTTDGKVYRRVEAGTYPVGRTTADGHLTTSAAPTGKVTEATKTVTYVYQEVKGNVQITYVDTNGVSIKTTVADTTNAPIGTAYDTKQNANEYPSEITTTDGKVYRRVEAGTYPVGRTTADGHLTTSDAPTGKVTEATKTVTYVYQEVKGNVQITYVDTNGVSIKTTVADTTNAPIGTSYDTKQNANEYPSEITTTDGKVYRRVEAGTYPVGRTTTDGHLTTSAAPTGKVTEGTKTVTYVYQEVKGNVQITYVDTNGTSIKTTVADTTNASIGTAYDTKQNANEYPSEITTTDGKVYRRVEAGTYPVGRTTADGHLTTSAAPTGKVTEGTKTITYVYQEVKGNVTVEHVSDTGEVLIATAPVKTNAPVGEAYTTRNEEKITTPDGRVFTYSKVADDSAPVSGKVAEQPQHVKYVYTQVKGTVTVEHVSDTGEVLIPTAPVKTNAPVGEAYTTRNEERITTPDGRVFTYSKVADDSAPVSGKVTEQPQHVKYVYTQVDNDNDYDTERDE